MAIVLIFGGGAGWIVHRARVQRETVEAITRAGGRVYYDWESTGPNPAITRKPFWPRWLVDRVGSEYFDTVTRVDAVHRVSDAEMILIGRLHHLEALQIAANAVTDTGVSAIRGLSRLKWLELHQTAGITGAALANLDGFSQLEVLSLLHFAVTDGDLAHVARLTRLQWLQLSSPQITDAGLIYLEGLNDLRLLHLGKTQVTSDGLNRLRECPTSSRCTSMGVE